MQLPRRRFWSIPLIRDKQVLTLQDHGELGKQVVLPCYDIHRRANDENVGVRGVS